MVLESVIITSAIDAYEMKDIVVVSIPGGFLTTDIDEDIITVLWGVLAEIMVKTKPSI